MFAAAAFSPVVTPSSATENPTQDPEKFGVSVPCATAPDALAPPLVAPPASAALVRTRTSRKTPRLALAPLALEWNRHR